MCEALVSGSVLASQPAVMVFLDFQQIAVSSGSGERYSDFPAAPAF